METLIVVPIVNKIATTDVAHLLANPDPDSVPLAATSRCGVRGYVYAHGGRFGSLPICEACAAPDEQDCPGYGSRLNAYKNGCRCPACRKAQSEYRRAHYRVLATSGVRRCPECGGVKAPGASRCRACYHASTVKHGTNSTYARGCRCEPCRTAHSVYMTDYRRERRIAA